MPAPDSLPILTCDVGGSHVSVALCRNGPFRIGPACSGQFPSGLTASGFFDLLYRLGAQASAGSGELDGAALAMPNPFDAEAGISLMQHKLQFLYGLDLRVAVAEKFGWRPRQVNFVHDAAAFLLGEMAIGAAQGAAHAVGITLGTGVGSAFCRDGQLITEGFGLPPGGEIWNLPVNTGILEDFVSSGAIERSYKNRTGKQRDVASLAAVAAGDDAARAAFAEFGGHLGRALRGILASFVPDLAVLGGGISHAAELFLPSLLRELDGLRVKVVVSSLFERAALAGAAAAWFNNGIADGRPAKLASTGTP